MAYGQSPMYQLLLEQQNKRNQEKAANSGKDARVVNSILGGLPVIGQIGSGILNASTKGSPTQPANTNQTQAAPPPPPPPGHLQSQQFAGVPPQNLYPLNTPPPPQRPPTSGGISNIINSINRPPSSTQPTTGAGAGAAAGSGSSLPWLISLFL